MPSKFTFNVRPLDIDGDNIPDGDLVEKINSKGVVVSRKFVPYEKIKKIVDNIPKEPKQTTKKTRVIYKDSAITSTPTPGTEQQPVMVADKTGFGQYLKQGFGVGLGASAGKALFDGVASLFSSE